MKFLSLVLLVVVSISGCATGREQPVCATQDRAAAGTTQTVVPTPLRARPAAPLLYLISNHYAVLFAPDSVMELLQTWTEREVYGTRAPVLREFIWADMPLRDDSDLQKYVVRHTRLEALPARISAELLERGSAYVVDLWEMDDSKNLAQVNVVHLEAKGGTWRYFCSPGGDEILWVTDLIVD